MTRPPGGLLIPTGFIALLPLVRQFEPGVIRPIPDIAFAVGWPLVFVAVCGSVW